MSYGANDGRKGEAMNDKRRKYTAVVCQPHELLDRYPELTTRIEEELVYKLIDPVVKEAIKGECIVRFTETEQRENIGLIESRKYVYLEDIVRCKDCKYCTYQSNTTGLEEMLQFYYCCTISNQFKKRPDDYCSYGERRSDGME